MDSISFREWSRFLFPYPRDRQSVIMLMAYFDDSGTHGGSPLVISGGLIGTLEQWEKFEKAWKYELDNPPSGHAPIGRFHAFDCQNALNEYRGWTRTESEHHQNQLVRVIISSEVNGYAVALPVAEWEKRITGGLRVALGSAEQFCVTSAVLFGTGSITDFEGEKDVAIMFDDRTKAINEHAERVKKVFKFNKKRGISPSKLDIVTFAIASSKKYLQLQGADMIAWLFYQQAKAFAGECHEENVLQLFGKLHNTGRMTLQFGNAHQIEAISKQEYEPGFLEEMAQLINGSYDVDLDDA